MKNKKNNIVALLTVILFGTIYGLLTNSIFDTLVSELWTPFAVALYFFVFAVLLCVLIIIIVKILKVDTLKRIIVKDMSLLLVVLFVVSMLFEFLYEIGLNVKIEEADSYILVIDDSGSMSGNDPEGEREKAIETLIKDKSSDFKYAVYVFSDETKQVRNMQPKSTGKASLDLQANGGTAMFGCLEKILSDVSNGELNVSTATRVLLLSDGYAGDTPLVKSKLLKKYVENNMVISTIGLGSGVDTTTMKRIAEYTGGAYIHVDDASKIDTALLDASVQTASRNLLGYRGFCKTDTLHAILRIVFLLIIIALIFILKIYSYGSYYNPNLIVSGISCIMAGFLPEIALQLFSWGDNFTRVIFCILISITLFKILIPIKRMSKRNQDDDFDFSEIDIQDSSSLEEKHQTNNINISSLR